MLDLAQWTPSWRGRWRPSGTSWTATWRSSPRPAETSCPRSSCISWSTTPNPSLTESCWRIFMLQETRLVNELQDRNFWPKLKYLSAFVRGRGRTFLYWCFAWMFPNIKTWLNLGTLHTERLTWFSPFSTVWWRRALTRPWEERRCWGCITPAKRPWRSLETSRQPPSVVTLECLKWGLTTPPSRPPPTVSLRPPRPTTGSRLLPATPPPDLLHLLLLVDQRPRLLAPDLLLLWVGDLLVELPLSQADPGQATFLLLSFLRKYLWIVCQLQLSSQTRAIILCCTTHFTDH